MRLSLALLPFLLFSGCLAASHNQTDDGSTSDEGAIASEAGRQGVVFYNEPYEVLPNAPIEFEVQVPEGATNVELEMSVSGASTPLDEAVVTLSGCGQGYVTWNPGPNLIVSVNGGGSWREAALCERASGGVRTVTVDTGATPMTGRILLRADLPDA